MRRTITSSRGSSLLQIRLPAQDEGEEPPFRLQLQAGWPVSAEILLHTKVVSTLREHFLQCMKVFSAFMNER